MSAWATLPDGSTRALIRIPQWDFAWQDAYRYAAPFWLPAGTTIFTQFDFDNSAANPSNPVVPPVRALWGFRSSDEMADTWIQVLARTETDRQRLVAAFRLKADREDIAGYETRIRMDPGYAALHNDVAVLYLETGQAAAAAAHFQEVARLQPQSAVARFNVGTALEAGGHPDDAAAWYRQAIDLDGSYAPAHVNLGTLLLKAGRVADARAEYEAALRADASNADAHNDLGKILSVSAGDEAAALAHLNEALRLRPAFPEAHLNIAEVLMSRGEARTAIEHYREALRLRPEWIPCMERLALALSHTAAQEGGSSAEAIAMATRAVELTGRRDADALNTLATVKAQAPR
jgi:tetratricopeptide (TPR) repeat protein